MTDTPAAPAAPASTPSAPPSSGQPDMGTGKFWARAAADTAKQNGTPTGLPGEEERTEGSLWGANAPDAEGAAGPVAPDTGKPYSLELPDSVVKQFPDLQGLSFDPADIADDPVLGPLAKVGLEVAARHGLTQAAVSDVAALMAYQTAVTAKAEDIEIRAALADQMKQLGANGPARADSVIRWLQGNLPREQADAMINNRMFTKSMIEGFETIMRKINSGGMPSPRHGGEMFGSGSDLYAIGEAANSSPGRAFRIAAAMAKGRTGRR